MGLFDRSINDTTFNPIYLDDNSGFVGACADSVWEEDTDIFLQIQQNRQLQQDYEDLVVMYGEDYVRQNAYIWKGHLYA